MEERQQIALSEFTGLNTRLSKIEMPESDSPLCLNVNFSEGGILPRKDYSSLSGVPADYYWNGVYPGLYENLVYGSGFSNTTATVFSWDGSQNSWGWSSIKTGLVGYRAFPSFASYNSLDMMVNGVNGDIPQKWNGTTWADLGGTPPRANQILVWRNRVWLAGLGTGYEGEVRYSDLENGESGWEQFIRVSKDSVGHNVIGMAAPAGDDGALIIFCDRSIYKFEGFSRSTFSVEPVNFEVGCSDWKSIVVADGLMYWHDRSGFYCSPDGGVTVNNISWKIYPGLLEYCDFTSAIVGFEVPDLKQIWWNFRGLRDNTVKPFLTRWIAYEYGQSSPLSDHREGRHVWSQHNRNATFTLTDFSSRTIAFGGRVTKADGSQYYVAGGRDFIWDISPSGGLTKWFAYQTKVFQLSGSWSVYALLRKLHIILDEVGDAGADLSVIISLDNSNYNDFIETIDFQSDGVPLGTFALDTDTLADEKPGIHPVWFNQICRSVQIGLKMTTSTDRFKIHELVMEIGNRLSTR